MTSQSGKRCIRVSNTLLLKRLIACRAFYFAATNLLLGANAMNYNTRLTRLPDGYLPPIVEHAFSVAQTLFQAVAIVPHLLRTQPTRDWISGVVAMTTVMDGHIREIHNGRSPMSNQFLANLAGVGRPMSFCGSHGPSTHEWTFIYAKQRIEDLGVRIDRTVSPLPDIQLYRAGLVGSPFGPPTADQHSALVRRYLEAHIGEFRKYVRSHLAPEEQLVYSNLKAEACRMADRSADSSTDRVQFDDDTRRVLIDGIPFSVPDPTAYGAFKAIASVRPRRITSGEIGRSTPGLLGKKMAREFAKLPKQLRALVDTTNAGHCLTLPSPKSS